MSLYVLYVYYYLYAFLITNIKKRSFCHISQRGETGMFEGEALRFYPPLLGINILFVCAYTEGDKRLGYK